MIKLNSHRTREKKSMIGSAGLESANQSSFIMQGTSSR
jgi:hypothetical protein